jgi:hypothetical protein
VSLRPLVSSWNAFFFAPQSPAPVALYRILYGLLVIADLVLLHGDWLTWFGADGLVSIDTMRKVSPGIRLNVFLILPQGDQWIQAFFWVFLVLALFLTVGFLSRFTSIAVFLCLMSIHQRNLFILNSGDTLLRVTGFFLMFAPAGAAISVDRLWRIWRGKEGVEVLPRSPWAQRMIQIQSALVYFSTFCWKMRGTKWIDGTALYYTTQLMEFQRFPMPSLGNGLLLRLATWSALLIEFALGILVWFRKIRYGVLLLGVGLHLFLEYSMNVPLFQWIAMASYVTFIDAADLSRAWAWLRRSLARRLGNPLDVIYDGADSRAVRLANVLRAVDVFARLNMIERHSANVGSEWPALSGLRGRPTLLVEVHGFVYEGFKGLLAISRVVPLLWWLAPFLFLSGQRKQSFRVPKAIL